MGHVAAGLLIADTDLAIDFLRDHLPGADLVQRWLEAGRLRFSAITAFELRMGADFPLRERRIHSLLARRTVALDAAAALVAGGIASRLRGAGRSIDVRDALIAGTCISLDLPLATRNTRHFERVPALRLVDEDG